MNASLKQNITFTADAKVDEKRYSNAIRVCAMQSDVAQIPGGHDAEIGTSCSPPLQLQHGVALHRTTVNKAPLCAPWRLTSR